MFLFLSDTFVVQFIFSCYQGCYRNFFKDRHAKRMSRNLFLSTLGFDVRKRKHQRQEGDKNNDSNRKSSKSSVTALKLRKIEGEN